MVTKCKSSVFCVSFLVCFLLGCICGLLLLRIVLCRNAQWLCQYCQSLEPLHGKRMLEAILLWICPMMLLLVVYLMSWQRLLFWLVAVRSACMAYSLGAFWVAGMSVWDLMRRNVILLPVFCIGCALVWKRREAILCM